MIQIIPLDRYNWEQCLNLQLNPEQQTFLPPVLYSLAQCKFENLKPFGILDGEEMVGLLMYGEFGGICWVSRIMVDFSKQRQGIGRAAMQQLLAILDRNISCRDIRTSYAPENHAAASFFESLGFVPIPAQLEDEVVAQYQRSLF